jgi:hypothetical protein
MLVIRTAQMEALNRSSMAAFTGRLAKIFLEKRPDRFADSGLAGADAFVRRNLPLAQKYGATSERSVAMLLYFVLVHGEEFESAPEDRWAVEVLRDPSDPDGNSRVERLIARMEAYAAVSSPAAART